MNGPRSAWLRRLPAVFSGLIALFAVYKMEGTSAAVPIWTAVVLLSAFVPVRLPDNAGIQWLLRLPMLGFVIASNLWRSVDIVNMYDTHTMTWFGEVCAAELTLAYWAQEPRTGIAMRPLWLSGLVLFAASSTPDENFLVAIAPAYFCALLVALRTPLRPPAPQAKNRKVVPWRHALAVLCVLLGGAGISAILSAQKSALTQWGMQLLGERMPIEAGALSFNTTLGSTFGQRGSLTRALRIEGEGDLSHLRGAAYTNYSRGSWGSRAVLGEDEESIGTELEPSRPAPTVRVTRLLNNRGVVFAPIDCAGLHFAEPTILFRVKTRGGMIRARASAPSQYDIALADRADNQGPLCVPPTDAERRLLLAVPPEIDARVRRLGATITGSITDPRRRIEAIAYYLTTHHHYSLRIDIGSGDPVSNFLLQRKSAHCEYFASAAVILARLAGVPSRYVIGYSAHEQDGPRVTVVRQRDAHAWAECWLDGAGWVVLDATPGDGRPDALKEKPNIFAQWIERLQDAVTALKLGAHRRALLLLVGAAAGIIALVTLIRGLLGLLEARRERGRNLAYFSGDAELAALLRDFESAVRRLGLVCPRGKTWLEFLDTVDPAADAARLTGQQLGAALSFLETYNRLRFGVSSTERQAPEGASGGTLASTRVTPDNRSLGPSVSVAPDRDFAAMRSDLSRIRHAPGSTI